jgi:hypothetical protein
MPSQRMRAEGGRVHGFQLWVNLPAKDKMIAPRYQDTPAARIPKAQTEDGLAEVRVVAGEALGVAAVIETRTPIAYHDWTLHPGASVDVAIPAEMNACIYVFGGRARVGVEGREASEGQLAVLGPGTSVRLGCAADAEGDARLLLLAGVPIKEPVAWYGPFVMNTREQIEQAVRDYQAGRMGQIAR